MDWMWVEERTGTWEGGENRRAKEEDRRTKVRKVGLGA